MRHQTKPTNDEAHEEASAAKAADQFAAQLVKSLMMPAPDGLQVFDELEKRPARKP